MSSLQKFHRRTQLFVVNTLHTGTVSISGTAVVGSVLTASNNIADVDGLGTFTYQWKRSGNNISGANASTYTLVSADVGNTITVSITYTDGKGFTETETSTATASVIIPLIIGDGNDSKGYYLGMAGDGTSYMYVAPKSTEFKGWESSWGSYGIVRGITSTTNGVANTNALYSFGGTTVSGHPAAVYCKTRTTGGYNTWYLPAKNELITCYSNRLATPFATNNAFFNYAHFTSTESDGNYAWSVNFNDGGVNPGKKLWNFFYCRAVRRSVV